MGNTLPTNGGIEPEHRQLRAIGLVRAGDRVAARPDRHELGSRSSSMKRTRRACRSKSPPGGDTHRARGWIASAVVQTAQFLFEIVGPTGAPT